MSYSDRLQCKFKISILAGTGPSRLSVGDIDVRFREVWGLKYHYTGIMRKEGLPTILYRRGSLHPLLRTETSNCSRLHERRSYNVFGYTVPTPPCSAPVHEITGFSRFVYAAIFFKDERTSFETPHECASYLYSYQPKQLSF